MMIAVLSEAHVSRIKRKAGRLAKFGTSSVSTASRLTKFGSSSASTNKATKATKATKTSGETSESGSGSQIRPQGTSESSEGGVGGRVGGSGSPGGPHIGRDVEMIDLAEKDGDAMMSNPMRSVDNPLRSASRSSSTAPMVPSGNR